MARVGGLPTPGGRSHAVHPLKERVSEEDHREAEQEHENPYHAATVLFRQLRVQSHADSIAVLTGCEQTVVNGGTSCDPMFQGSRLGRLLMLTGGLPSERLPR